MNKEQEIIKKIESKLAEMVGKKENYSLEDVLKSYYLDDSEDGYTDDTLDLLDIWIFNTPFHLQSQKCKNFVGYLILSE